MRYIPNTEEDKQRILEFIGCDDIDQLFAPLPPGIRLKNRLNIPDAMDEFRLSQHIQELSDKNSVMPSFLGAGIYDHFRPAIIKTVLSNGNFFTAYTPYQPEVSQGTLQNIFEFQTYICELTGLSAANASMYDGASATAEAISLALLQSKKKKVLLSDGLNPLYIKVIETYMAGRDVDIQRVPIQDGQTDQKALKGFLGDDCACFVAQQPNFYGCIEDMPAYSQVLKENSKALFISVADPITLAILAPPGEYGADIAVGEGQSLGLPLSFGGPGFGFFATRAELARFMPGRIVGQTKDSEGNRGFVLTLQTREQHIRRERASSNICSNQALCALAASVYLTAMGIDGLTKVAEASYAKAHYALEQFCKVSELKPCYNAPFFREFALTLPGSAQSLNRYLLENQIIGGLPLSHPAVGGPDNIMLFAFTEKNTKAQIDRLISLVTEWVEKQSKIRGK